MSKSFRAQAAAAAIALTLAGVAGPAAAQESLPARAVSALGIVIADQGNAALAQIRKDLKENLLERIAPYLPLPDSGEVSPDPKPANMPGSRR